MLWPSAFGFSHAGYMVALGARVAENEVAFILFFGRKFEAVLSEAYFACSGHFLHVLSCYGGGGYGCEPCK